jgi:alpha-tubulin suppressor-like RCC1 family protein
MRTRVFIACLGTILGILLLAVSSNGPAGAATSPEWIHIAAGGNVTCGIREGNTLWCWGAGAYGALGNGQTGNETLPAQVTKPATAGWTSITHGGGHGCAIRTGGSLWCWGYNGQGELGTGTGNVDTPHQVKSPATTGWTAVSAGPNQTCATRSDGTLWCWGYNGDGQLGIGTTTRHNMPQQVTSPAATGWASVSAGFSYTCATRTDGSLWCWGDNLEGQLGDSTTANSTLPMQVALPAATGWATVAAGGNHTCATRTDSSLYCWGDNLYGEVGTGSTTAQFETPQQVVSPATTGWASPVSGEFHTCARRGGDLYCWGANSSGQLGIGSTTGANVPERVTVPSATGWSLITAGDFHSCATHTGKLLYCWGNNAQGQLGLGTTTSEDTPQQVTG